MNSSSWLRIFLNVPADSRLCNTWDNNVLFIQVVAQKQHRIVRPGFLHNGRNTFG
jgi:hypothetical protein